MFLFPRFQCLRSLLTVGLLVLIVYLLILDPPDRRPFVQRLVIRTVGAVEWFCAKARDVALTDSQRQFPAAEVEEEPLAPELPATLPRRRRDSDLPMDFLSELERAVARAGDRTTEADWADLCLSQDPASKANAAARLARALPSHWWPVDGELVHELDLPVVLRARPGR